MIAMLRDGIRFIIFELNISKTFIYCYKNFHIFTEIEAMDRQKKALLTLPLTNCKTKCLKKKCDGIEVSFLSTNALEASKL